jgi:uncharacterized membrane protein YcaP (DUF421 family)
MWKLDLPWWELIVRATVMYFFLLVLLRLTGKRQVGQLAPFDLVLLLILSNAVQNAMNGNDSSVTGGMLLAVTLVALNFLIGALTFRSKKLEALIEGRPIMLIHNGHVDQMAMKKAQMTMEELEAALRAEGYSCPVDVRFAVLENNGHLTAIGIDKK